MKGREGTSGAVREQSDKGPYRPEARVRSKLSKLDHIVFSIDY